jgi:hypothetical protein
MSQQIGILHNLVEKLSGEVFDDRRKTHVSLYIQDLELLAPSSRVVEFSKLITRSINPVLQDYPGRLILRYIKGVIFDPDGTASHFGKIITPYVHFVDPIVGSDPYDTCLFLLRRAIYLKQLRNGVRRNVFTRTTIQSRTSEYIQNSRLGELIHSRFRRPS